MGMLHLVGGEKGGVGKSFTARLLAQYIIDHQVPLIAFDSDRSNATLSRFYGDYTSAINVDDYSSLDQIIDAADKHRDAHIVVDLAAQTFSKLDKWVTESDVFGLMAELGHQVIYWHVMDPGVDSMHLLDTLLEAQDTNSVKVVAVKNYGRGKSFSNFENSTTAENASKKGIKFLTLANLNEDLAHKIDFKNFSFWAAVNNSEALSLAERRRTKTWVNFNYAQINKIISLD